MANLESMEFPVLMERMVDQESMERMAFLELMDFEDLRVLQALQVSFSLNDFRR
jgi:hypothetical protein